MKNSFSLILTFIVLIGANLFTAKNGLSKVPNSNPGLNAIYGEDNRSFIDSTSQLGLFKLSQSVALIINQDDLQDGTQYEDGLGRILAQGLHENLNVCLDVPHAKVPTVNGCTGFLVHRDILLTAGHCFFDESDCLNKKFIFEVTRQNIEELASTNRPVYRVKESQIYSCKKIIGMGHMGDELDFALVQLDRKVVGKRPMKVNLYGEIGPQMQVFMLGHPLGMPLMKTGTSGIIPSSQHFLTSLDSFVGNSGGPVLNKKTLAVEGLLVQGQDDFVLDEKMSCLRPSIYPENKPGEVVLKMSALKAWKKYFLYSK